MSCSDCGGSTPAAAGRGALPLRLAVRNEFDRRQNN
jgi:hypothetical protein